MDLQIKNAFVVDFDSLTFKKLNVGIKDGVIVSLSQNEIQAKENLDGEGLYLSPGLIDCHCHIESTHLTPNGFANTVSRFGTLYAVADCHEIANVAGIDGLNYFMDEAKNSPINIFFAIPSCVPATPFATSGGKIDVDDVKKLIKSELVLSLGELMNVMGVVNGEQRFLEMIKITREAGKRVNGHAPHLDLEVLRKYKEKGVEDDHESYGYDEIKQKLELGFFVFLREGSTEITDDQAYKIIKEYPNRVAFCTDDKTVGDILRTGHINYNIKKAIKNGVDPALALKVASFNGLKYYGLDKYSEIKVGNVANLVLFDEEFNAKTVIVNGKTLKEQKVISVETPDFLKNSIHVKTPFSIPKVKNKNIAIKVNDGSLITDKLTVEPFEGEYDTERDLLKLVVIERYGHGFSSVCLINGFGLKKGALASSLAHDCHNIVAVGTSDKYLTKSIEKIIEMQGGQVAYDGKNFTVLPLEIGGIVTREEPQKVAKMVENLKLAAHKLGCPPKSPFDMLSFMALEVIPHLKLTDRGLFDVDKFAYVGDENELPKGR